MPVNVHVWEEQLQFINWVAGNTAILKANHL